MNRKEMTKKDIYDDLKLKKPIDIHYIHDVHGIHYVFSLVPGKPVVKGIDLETLI